MLDSFLKFVLLPLLVSVVAEVIAEWLMCKWQNKCDNQSFIFPFIYFDERGKRKLRSHIFNFKHYTGLFELALPYLA